MYGHHYAAQNRRPPGGLNGPNLSLAVQRIPRSLPPVACVRWTTPNVELIEQLDAFAYRHRDLSHTETIFSQLTGILTNATKFHPIPGDPVSDAIRVLLSAPIASVERVCVA